MNELGFAIADTFKNTSSAKGGEHQSALSNQIQDLMTHKNTVCPFWISFIFLLF